MIKSGHKAYKNMWKLGIVEDDRPLLSALTDFFNEQVNCRCVLTTDSMANFFETWNRSVKVDVLLLDIILGEENSLNHLYELKTLIPACKVIIITGKRDSDLLIKALAEGADSYYVKGSDLNQLLNIIDVTMKGGAYIDPYLAPELVDIIRRQSGVTQEKVLTRQLNRLTEEYELHEREIQVAKGLISGLSYQEISNDLNIALDTVRHYVKSLYKKLEVNNKVQLFRKINSLP